MASFAQNIGKFLEKTKLKGTVVLRKIAMDGLRGVVMKTPVDTGRCRGSWRVAINRVDKSVEKEGAQSKKKGATPDSSNGAAAAQKAITAGNATIVKAEWTDSIMITNNLPYAPALERGHSKQAPAGMLGVTFTEIKNSIQKAVQAMTGGNSGT